mmetsp:Transcript_28489/g.43073  ORF Transcript_28489/g.43073 Transcript_28489/m.43073 type:complete len:132 (+) Transcript_28489:246-641(+)
MLMMDNPIQQPFQNQVIARYLSQKQKSSTKCPGKATAYKTYVDKYLNFSKKRTRDSETVISFPLTPGKGTIVCIQNVMISNRKNVQRPPSFGNLQTQEKIFFLGLDTTRAVRSTCLDEFFSILPTLFIGKC